MSKPVFYILIFVITSYSLKAQNLVPNPSFENFSTCPIQDGQIQYALPWVSANGGSPDLFNICANPSGQITGVPNNWQGVQMPRTGEGYAGIFVYTGESIEVREYIQAPLLSPLDSGELYKVEFYVSLGDYSQNAVNQLGIHFSDGPINSSELSALVCCQPQVMMNSFVTDYSGWTKVLGCYIATGEEEYITIGNFNNDANTNLQYQSNPSGGGVESYYYIEDVSVVQISDSIMCQEPEVTLSIPNVFTPNNDLSNDYWTIDFVSDEEYAIIFNRWGNVVTELSINNSSWDGTAHSNRCADGVYYYKAWIREEFKTGFIQLVR